MHMRHENSIRLQPKKLFLQAHPNDAGEDRSDERCAQEDEHAARHPPEADLEL